MFSYSFDYLTTVACLLYVECCSAVFSVRTGIIFGPLLCRRQTVSYTLHPHRFPSAMSLNAPTTPTELFSSPILWAGAIFPST
jgi:hypothetical protein